MSADICMTLLIKGDFCEYTFTEWIRQHATKLSLTGSVRVRNKQLIEVMVCGDRIIIEALEVACSLGPVDANVHSIESLHAEALDTSYRQPGLFVRY